MITDVNMRWVNSPATKPEETGCVRGVYLRLDEDVEWLTYYNHEGHCIVYGYTIKKRPVRPEDTK